VSAAVEVTTAVASALSAHDLVLVASLHEPAARIEFAGTGRSLDVDSWLRVTAGLITAMPDFVVRPLSVLGDDDAALAEVVMTGVNTGRIVLTDWDRALLGTDEVSLPPTGRTVEVTGVVATDVAGGRVTHSRVHFPPGWFHVGVGLVTVAPRPISPEPTTSGRTYPCSDGPPQSY
jgi:hypothetical protein